MNWVLPRCIIVVTIFLWIPLSNGCMNTAFIEFQNCTAKLNVSFSLQLDEASLKSQMDIICKMESKDKQVFQRCFDDLKQCDQFRMISDILGINILKLMGASEKLCKDEDVILHGMPCLLEKTAGVTNASKEFQPLFEKMNGLFLQQTMHKITREEYNRKYCPLLKEVIEKMADIRCPEKFTKIIQNYGYDIMSDKCRSINNFASSVPASPFIPPSNGCAVKATGEYRKCLSKLYPNLTLFKLSPGGLIEFMCSVAKSKDKELLNSCFYHFKNCEQFSRTVDILGFDISRWLETFEKLCQHEEIVLENLPCLLDYMTNLLNNKSMNELKEFQLLFEKGRDLFMQQAQYKITRLEYYKRYCPILKDGIEKLTDLKCPEKFIEIIQKNSYYFMSDKCRYIDNITSVVSTFWWIPLGDGCMEKDISEFQKCTSKFNLNLMDGILNPRSQMELICKMGPKNKELLQSCFDKLTKCVQFRTISNILGINIFRLMEANEKLCKNEEVTANGLTCLIQKMKNAEAGTPTKLQRLFEKGKDLFMQQTRYKITREEYYEKYCPLLDEGIKKLADFKCPEKSTKIIQDYSYDIISDTCKAINKGDDSSGIKSLPNISFISLLLLILLFVIS